MPAADWITTLGLEPHPEGGLYARTWADDASSAIYYLLRRGEESAWHRVHERSEVWHHYAGAPLRLEISEDGEAVREVLLGTHPSVGERPQGVVPPGAWQSAVSLGDWTLVGCTVAPAFSFDAFELAPAGWAPGAFGPLVSAHWLAENLGGVALVDVRWFQDGRSGREPYEQGHLPAARWIDLDTALADPPSIAEGRHPLPSPERFAAAMSAAGVDDAMPVVAYDDGGGMSAARLVWLLRALGHPAALLDGGLAGWEGPLETGDANEVNPPAATFTPRSWPAEFLADVDSLGAATVLLDARASERYRGEVEPMDARAGHIPGAANAPWMANLDGGRFATAAALRDRFAALGAAPGIDGVVVYCGSGVTACHTLLALEAAGIGGAKLYPGSWSQWSGDPDRRAVLGDQPS